MSSFFPTHAVARRLLYELLHVWCGIKGYSTFNIGMAPVAAEVLAERKFAREACQIQLYADLIDFAQRAAPLQPNARVLEVGAAGGGGVRYLRWRLPQAAVVGVDNASVAVLIGRLRGFDIRHAGAGKLPFANDSVDCVLCVDSFSIFPQEAYLAEARRVLKPHGLVLIADYLEASTETLRDNLEHLAADAELQVCRFEDATPGVLRALERDGERKAAAIRNLPNAIQRQLAETMSLRGSERYANWQSGKNSYYLAALRQRGEEPIVR